jgi:spore maturation protein CgeB
VRLMIAGSWRWPQYEEACAVTLKALGVELVKFRWDDFLGGATGRLQGKFPLLPGPALMRINQKLMQSVEETMPNVVLVWRGTHILPWTLKAIRKRTGAFLVSYNNDDPFGWAAHGKVPWHHRFYWRWFLKSIPYYDLHFVFRSVNISEMLGARAKAAYVLKPYFIPSIHRPIEIDDQERDKWDCDVVFVGHYEPDGRERYLRALVEGGLHVRLFGGGYWSPSVLGKLASHFGAIRPVYGDEYAKALCGARMCLCFLSRINRDAYTTRCFEIPACGRVLLSERTVELQDMFKEGEEALFFSNPEELLGKALWLREHQKDRQRIAQAGMRRVYADGHSVEDRMKEMIRIIDEHRQGHGTRNEET